MIGEGEGCQLAHSLPHGLYGEWMTETFARRRSHGGVLTDVQKYVPPDRVSLWRFLGGKIPPRFWIIFPSPFCGNLVIANNLVTTLRDGAMMASVSHASPIHYDSVQS